MPSCRFLFFSLVLTYSNNLNSINLFSCAYHLWRLSIDCLSQPSENGRETKIDVVGGAHYGHNLRVRCSRGGRAPRSGHDHATYKVNFNLLIHKSVIFFIIFRRSEAEYKRWQEAARFINNEDSRIRTEIRLINGTECNVWIWTGVEKQRWQGTGN